MEIAASWLLSYWGEMKEDDHWGAKVRIVFIVIWIAFDVR